eukprot:sb/3477057/
MDEAGEHLGSMDPGISWHLRREKTGLSHLVFRWTCRTRWLTNQNSLFMSRDWLSANQGPRSVDVNRAIGWRAPHHNWVLFKLEERVEQKVLGQNLEEIRYACEVCMSGSGM